VGEAEAYEQELRTGIVLADRYSVLRELGRGGMAAVYLCTDRVSNESVAVKVLSLKQLPEGTNYALWFHQEARALAALDHPSIVRARDFSTLPDGSPYLVMDAVEGQSLHVWKHRGWIPWPVIWTIVDQVLSGLAHAHARGIIHGDLKPSNIMVDPRGGRETPQCSVLDLGLAWLLADHIDRRLSGREIHAPAMPIGGGTVGWLAPEQIRHATPHIGPPTDLYALGCILYELVTGHEVFEGEHDDVLQAHRDLPAPPPDLRADIPEKVSDFTLKLLAKRPWHRYRFAADALDVWEELQPEESILWSPRVPGPKRPAVSMSATVKKDVPKTPEQTARNLTPGILTLRPCPLVGREKEKLACQQHVEEVVNGTGPRHMLGVVEGDAGIGKSRLLEWLCEYVHERGLMVPLRAKYQQIPGPMDGVRGALLSHYNLVGQTREIIEQALLNEWEVERDDDAGKTWVAATAAWLKPYAPREPVTIGPSGKRFVLDKPDLARVIAHYALERLARGLPILIWLDDLHLATQATFQALCELHDDAKSLRFILVASLRRESLAANPDVATRIDQLCQAIPSFRLQLTTLTPKDTRRLLQASLPLDTSAEDAVIKRAKGNPLFALQLLHAWSSGGFLHLGKQGVYQVDPEAINEQVETTGSIWEERLSTLPAAYRPAALAAATLGVDFPYFILAELLTQLGINAAKAIGTLQKTHILLPETGQRLRWIHPLLHEFVMGRLMASPHARKIFRLSAETLVMHPDSGTQRLLLHRVHNLFLANENQMAAETLFQHIATAWARVRDVSETIGALAKLEGRVSGKYQSLYDRWFAEVKRLQGDLRTARQCAESAGIAFCSAHDTENEAHCLRLLAQISCDEGRPGAGRQDAETAYAKFVATGNDIGRAECEFVLGQIDALRGDHDAAAARLHRAAEGFRQGGELLSLAQCILVQARAEMAAGRKRSTRALLMQARKEFESIGYQVGLCQVDLAIAQLNHSMEQYPEALQLALDTKQHFIELRHIRGMIDCNRMAAMTCFDLNDYTRADAFAREALSLATETTSDSWGKVEAWCILAQIALIQNNLEVAAYCCDQADEVVIDDAEPSQHRDLTNAWLRLMRHEYLECIEILDMARKAFANPRRVGDHTPQLIQLLLTYAKDTPVEKPLLRWQKTLQRRNSMPPPPTE
jgi:eukaryotic-like serine/threonine-protein kinase